MKSIEFQLFLCHYNLCIMGRIYNTLVQCSRDPLNPVIITSYSFVQESYKASLKHVLSKHFPIPLLPSDCGRALTLICQYLKTPWGTPYSNFHLVKLKRLNLRGEQLCGTFPISSPVLNASHVHVNPENDRGRPPQYCWDRVTARSSEWL